MKIGALLSGGKDSLFALHAVVASGHDVTCIGHIYPEDGGEPDSEMYQSVATEGISLVAQALELPIFTQGSKSKSNCSTMDYTPSEGDEVEDLYLLLAKMKKQMQIDGICCGALLSDYQRVRVESVCSRLGLVSLAPLWQKDQKQYIQDLSQLGFEVVIVKVAALGLNRKHVGKLLHELTPTLLTLEEKFGVHPAGEGGEFESFVTDCPLYKKKIALEETETILHSDDFDAPVYYLQIKKASLETKSFRQSESGNADWRLSPAMRQYRSDAAAVPAVTEGKIIASDGRFVAISGLSSSTLAAALETVNCGLKARGLNRADIVQVQLFLRDLSQFNTMNAAYNEFFKGEKKTPTRLCVEVDLPPDQSFIINVLARGGDSGNSKRLKVTSRSNWACSVVGPYSQAALFNEELYLSGIIGLRGMEHLLAAGASNQLRLACSHRDQLIELMAPSFQAQSMYSFITSEDIATGTSIRSEDLGSFSILVSCLPRGASVEIAARVSASGLAHYCAAVDSKSEVKEIFERRRGKASQRLFFDLSSFCCRMNTAKDDEVIRTRLLLDGEGAGDDRKLTLLLKSFLRWCNSPEPDQAAGQKILQMLDQAEYQVKKLTMIAKANERQRQKYIDNEKEVEVEMSNASKMIEKATAELKEARKYKSNQQEYDAFAKIINKHPDRATSNAEIEKIKEDIDALTIEKEGLDSKLNERRKEVHVLLQAIHGLEQKMRRVEAETSIEVMDITMDEEEEEE
ncbi:Oidioi.mRNA.OKI2018_I69.XSR.g13729.t1.cds [Oikopleura dioica]|uniref:Diphthine--ammonia ligase n=1 Tax=Oikopleura dioica TaxID=34765 RepID=A0ABN7SCU9_OIKDI|nr:Oidioi.mRNA.OKI2018_I69.XSR.g13729.t1.cds [Oikopleura dioica]